LLRNKKLQNSAGVSFCRLLAALFLFSGIAMAYGQAGPPFRTDDPETPGNKHWEINFGWMGDRNSEGGDYSIPDLDVNYGLGDRIQLKYELPIALRETRASGGISPTQKPLEVGLGESLLGVKWRFYEHMPTSDAGNRDEDEAAAPNFSISTYPQVALKYPTTMTANAGLPDWSQFLLPIETNARLGPLRVDGEVGYWFTCGQIAQSWIRGMIVGHEFSGKSEAYVEIYDQQDANRVDGQAKKREATLGVGGRRALNRDNSVLLLLMGGRSFQTVAHGNGQPSWIAYVGVQLLLAPKEKDHMAGGLIPGERF
jgi:hypothetical protein